MVAAPRTGEALYAIYADLSPHSREWGMVPVVSIFFTLSTLPFIALGYAMGREFKNFPALHAYAINAAGSLAGLLAFSLLSYFSTPPLVWSRRPPFSSLGREATELCSVSPLPGTDILSGAKPSPKGP